MLEPDSHLPRQRWAPWLALVLLSLLFWGAAGRMHVTADGVRYHSLDDDQMISMRYARHLADGLGPVWNAGERVEGYTNFGWVLACAIVAAAGRLLVALGGGALAWAVLVPLVLSRAFTTWYRDQPVPLPFLMEHCALYVRADSPERAGLGRWREPRVERP